jgi:predicted NACHT family NTPase
MSPDAVYLLQLMKQQIDHLIASDEQLQAFLSWVSQKSRAVLADKKPVIMRAFYFDLALARTLAAVGGSTFDLARAFEHDITCNLQRTLALDLALDRALGFEQVVDLTLDPNRVFECVLKRALARSHVLEPMLEHSLQQLLEQKPDWGRDGKKFKQWWSAHGRAWTEQLRAVMIAQRNIGHNWHFTDQQKAALKHYYNANMLLVDCLNRDSYGLRTVRSQIENTLLLPIAEISLQ